jgi:hypothetical protein
MSKAIDKITSTAVPLDQENVDTDQIIPARFLKATSRDGFGDNLFRDWRYNSDNTPKKDFVLNNPTYHGKILVAARTSAVDQAANTPPGPSKTPGSTSSSAASSPISLKTTRSTTSFCPSPSAMPSSKKSSPPSKKTRQPSSQSISPPRPSACPQPATQKNSTSTTIKKPASSMGTTTSTTS